MKLITSNIIVNMQKSFRVIVLLIALMEELFQNCLGSSIDGISLQFNKRGEWDEREENLDLLICTSAHKILQKYKKATVLSC